MGRESTSIEPELNARIYLFEAQDYEAAFEITDRFTELLERWGQYELLLHLLQQSVDTLEGKSKAGAMHNLGVILQDVGAYPQAQQLYEQSLQIAQELGDRAGVAGSLHQLGMLLQQQGEYAQAQQRYEQSLQIAQELGDRAGVAGSLWGLGMLLQAQGEYAQAQKLYEQSLQIKQELGDRAGVALSLGQLGLLAEAQENLSTAVRFLVQALTIFEQLGAPERKIVGSALARLREKMGEEAFLGALKEAGVDMEDHPPAEESQQPDTLQILLSNTYAVLKSMPEKRGEWWEELRKFQGGAQRNGDQDMAAFAGVLMRLLEGVSPDSLTEKVPQDYLQAWQALLEALSKEGSNE